jgi:hypothetical protein
MVVIHCHTGLDPVSRVVEGVIWAHLMQHSFTAFSNPTYPQNVIPLKARWRFITYLEEQWNRL